MPVHRRSSNNTTVKPDLLDPYQDIFFVRGSPRARSINALADVISQSLVIPCFTLCTVVVVVAAVSEPSNVFITDYF